MNHEMRTKKVWKRSGQPKDPFNICKTNIFVLMQINRKEDERRENYSWGETGCNYLSSWAKQDCPELEKWKLVNRNELVDQTTTTLVNACRVHRLVACSPLRPALPASCLNSDMVDAMAASITHLTSGRSTPKPNATVCFSSSQRSLRFSLYHWGRRGSTCFPGHSRSGTCLNPRRRICVVQGISLRLVSF